MQTCEMPLQKRWEPITILTAAYLGRMWNHALRALTQTQDPGAVRWQEYAIHCAMHENIKCLCQPSKTTQLSKVKAFFFLLDAFFFVQFCPSITAQKIYLLSVSLIESQMLSTFCLLCVYGVNHFCHVESSPKLWGLTYLSVLLLQRAPCWGPVRTVYSRTSHGFATELSSASGACWKVWAGSWGSAVMTEAVNHLINHHPLLWSNNGNRMHASKMAQLNLWKWNNFFREQSAEI